MVTLEPHILARRPGDERTETSDGSCRIAVLLDVSDSRTNLLHGLEWLDPGGESARWRADEFMHETYFLVSGSIRVTWDEGTVTMNSHDSLYLSPGQQYTAENIGPSQAVIVWTASQPIEAGP